MASVDSVEAALIAVSDHPYDDEEYDNDTGFGVPNAPALAGPVETEPVDENAIVLATIAAAGGGAVFALKRLAGN